MSNSWEKKEAEDRKKKFLEEYDLLTSKFQIKLLAFPEFIPDGQHGFNISSIMIPIDMKDKSIPSPLSDEKGKIL